MQILKQFKYAILTLLICLIATFSTVLVVDDHEKQEINKTLHQALNKFTEQLNADLSKQVFLYNWVAKQWLTFGQPDAFLWHQQAKYIIENHEFLQAVVWIDKHKTIQWIEPLIGNQAAYNLDLTKVPYINRILTEAADNGRVAAVSNWKLVQGFQGLLIYAPIGQGAEFKGFISGVIRQNEFIVNAAKLAINSGYQFSIRAQGEEIYHFYSQNEFERYPPVSTNINVFNQTWQIDLWPTQAELAKITTNYSHFTIWIGLLISLIFSIIVQLLVSARRYSNYLNQMNRDLEFQITEREKSELNLIKAANFDELTGLPNRSALAKHIHSKLQNPNTRHVAIVLIDLDHFKDVNDVLGHSAGDKLLIKVTQYLKQIIDEEYYFARVGGDELAVYIDELPSLVIIERLTQNILSCLDTRFQIDDYEFFTSASIGFAHAMNNQISATELIRNADSALNKAKDSGKNCVCQYTQQLHQNILKRVELARLLRQAIENNEFILYYQPKVDSLRNICTGFEALIRWKPSGSQHWINPEEFIKVAEETGLIVPLGEWIIDKACHQLQQWHLMGYTELSMAINISGRQLQTNNLLNVIQQTHKKYRLPSSALEIELTEQVFIENIIQHEDFMHKLTKSGISLSIDDFGIGYSSLSYLKNFPVDTLKIDRSFVKDLPHDFNDVCIVKAIINLAQSLDLTVVAEGVENQQQVQFLNQQGCKYIQGYYYSKPLNAEQITEQMKADDPIFRKTTDFVF
ncbi:EAL domain-containing protein [Catenovulum sp. 2E275]|uniref:bifunctional diguanylate cyclase/phosphodiesterase n=1 Tax=Catenovulum sp. 2E275 TaxID=2980497 RepID=UPI0021D0056B|nr:EAL domain-containing protein [Catenovulum sp. 2E275]MCU4676495.1 EAL domain-containing protein [Catenovulum sp. 2E275]